MASSLILHKRITTTLAKAKALRIYVEPLITKSKDDSTHSRRVVFSYLQDKEATTELFKEVSAKVADRPGGYTRIIKLAPRQGDSADMALIELVDFNELLVKDAKPKKAARRSRRGGGKASSEAKAEVVTSGETKAPENSESAD
jgi:large subunit ribosomal protein L17